MDFINKMQASGNEVDQRLLALYSLKVAERQKGDARGNGGGDGVGQCEIQDALNCIDQSQLQGV